MLSIRRKGPRRPGKARRSAARTVLRVGLRLAKPFGPGMVAAAAGSYFLDAAAGSERRKQALTRVGGLAAMLPGRKGS